jgi:acyl-CoA reductase-like NAD-dependent aldehyde dehydrogenase
MTSTADVTTDQAAGGMIAVDDPSTGAIIDHVPDMTADVPSLVARARTAQGPWEACGFEGRAAAMDAWRRWLVANRAKLVDSAMRESGQIYEEALFSEIYLIASGMKFWARKAEGFLRDERIAARDAYTFGRKIVVRQRPLGVIGVIAPWNFPILIGVGDCLPALMAGNASSSSRPSSPRSRRAWSSRARTCPGSPRTSSSARPAMAAPAPRSSTTST